MNQLRWVAIVVAILTALVATSQAHASVKTTSARITALEQRLDRQNEWINALTEQLMVYDECFDRAIKFGPMFVLVIQPNCLRQVPGGFRLRTSVPR